MKKVILLFLCIICICGCSKGWQKKVQVSDFTYENDYIVGKMKNLTNKAYKVKIDFSLINGSFVDDDICFDMIKPNEKLELKCYNSDINENYLIKIKNIELTKVDIPKLTEGIIDQKVLEYHFKDIYNSHALNLTSFSSDFTDSQYPYMNEIKYENNQITIKSEFNKDQNAVVIYSEYDTKNEELNCMHGIIAYINDNEFLKSMVFKIANMKSLNNKSYLYSTKIYNSLLDNNLEEGYCWNIDKWCIKPTKSENIYQFYINKKD